jgi:hypothetical protein
VGIPHRSDVTISPSAHYLPTVSRGRGQLVRSGLEEADPALVKTGCWPFVPVGSESLADAADHLPRPAGPLGGDANQRPVIAGEVFLAVDVNSTGYGPCGADHLRTR